MESGEIAHQLRTLGTLAVDVGPVSNTQFQRTDTFFWHLEQINSHMHKRVYITVNNLKMFLES